MICAKEDCSVEFEPTHHRQKYCPEHKTKPNRQRYRYVREALEGHPDPSGERPPSRNRFCQKLGCSKKIPEKRGNAKYCSRLCADAVAHAKRRKREKIRKIEEELHQIDVPETYRRGDAYQAMQEGLGDAIYDGILSQKGAAEIAGISEAQASRAYEAYLYDRVQAEAKTKWKRPRLTRAMLPTELFDEYRKLGRTKQGRESERFAELEDHLIRAHVQFARRYCRLEGERVIYKDFHVKWLRSLLRSMATGGKTLILSPPRHGKSELLIRFVLWLIIMDPNLRFMWVCANTDVAKLMLGAVKDYLMNHEELIRATLPPGESYKPPHGAGKPWSTKEIKVAQQTHVGAKSSSLLALGRTSKILSRDVDMMILDDIEDFDTTREPAQRLYTRNKLAEYNTRKMRWVAQVYIGSRNHPDDIPNYIAETGTRNGWEGQVYSAHDWDCAKDPDDWDAHVECMLFPEINDYEWLMEKKTDMEDLGIPGAFEMRYLNRPLPEDGVVFDVKEIRKKALDRSTVLGVAGLEVLPPGHLVAGLDPASRGMQAAFLWHYANKHLTAVDIETQEAGGFAGAIDVMQRWYDAYGLTDWFYEDNSQQVEFFSDPRMLELKNELGLNIRNHSTGKNKQDPELGISGMAPFFHNGSVTLPYGDTRSREIVEKFLRQLELWTTDGVNKKGGKTDIKMAAWFPFPRLVRWMRRDGAGQTRIAAPKERSYPRIRSMSQFPHTKYPGGRRR